MKNFSYLWLSVLSALSFLFTATIPTTGLATADSLVRNTSGFFAKRASDAKYYPAQLCFSTDGSQALVPCGKVPGGAGVTPGRLNTASTNVTTSAYVDVIASSSDAAHWINVYNGTSQELVVATGTSGSPTDRFYVPATNYSGGINLYLPAASKVSVKSMGSTASSGVVIVNLLQ